MITINCNNLQATPLLKKLIEHYQIWIDYRNTYVRLYQSNPGELIAPAIANIPDRPGINCYPSTDVTSIRQDPRRVVFIDNLTECINFKNYFRHYPKHKHYVIFSNGHWDEDYYRLPFSYSQVTYRYFLFDMADNFLSDNRLSFYINKTYEFGQKPYNFIATAGSARPEKDGFVNLLLKNICHDNYILRYNGEDLGHSYNDPLVKCLPMGYKADQMIPGLEKYFHSLSQTLPLDLYNRGYFNLLLEGDIHWDCQFNLTEKTVKTLITGMPFVMVGSPFFLKELRKLGFETYSSLWDESYDEIVDYDLRMNAIVDLCNQLYDFDWHSNFDKFKQIADRNRANFFKLDILAIKQFEQLESALASIPFDVYEFAV